MMGGKIWVDSEPGKGSAFIFTIQMMCGTEKKIDSLPSGINWDNVRVMAVDDDPAVLAYFKEITQGLGISCDTSLSGEEALKTIERNGIYHIYFVDWKMPGMNGLQLATELKTKVSANSVVIMISSFEWSAISEAAKLAGVDKFLPKPLFPSAIADAINESLGLNWKQPENAEPKDSKVFANRRILLVEDVEINREIVLTMLESTQMEIDCAENGLEAVQKFTEAPEKYDLIFMDVQMPEMDGYDATRSIRAVNAPNAKTIPIIAMTANVFREDVEKCLEAGMNGHIGKPLDFNEVMEQLQKYFSA